ncbi:DEAD-domain-containing protein [Salix suchowensis]|nr:DEAD-domain-containing protein [Salix suchowensis]
MKVPLGWWRPERRLNVLSRYTTGATGAGLSPNKHKQTRRRFVGTASRFVNFSTSYHQLSLPPPGSCPVPLLRPCYPHGSLRRVRVDVESCLRFFGASSFWAEEKLYPSQLGTPETIVVSEILSFVVKKSQKVHILTAYALDSWAHSGLFYRYRAESTAAAIETGTTTNNATQSPMPPSHPGQNAGVVSDLPEWKSLKGRIQHDTLKALTVKPYKYDKMTKVQADVLDQLPGLIAPPDAEDPDPPTRDLLVRARTGTGKTLAFLVPAVEARLAAIERAGKQAVIDAGVKSDKHLEDRARRAFARRHAGTLIISPTRELATQIANEAIKLTHHHEGFEVRLFVGGMSKRQQMREWARGRRDIVVGTPGRLRDVLQSESEVAHGLENTPMLILDEADTLLDLGFREDIESIKKFLPSSPERQTFLFSATVSSAVQQIAKSFLSDNHAFINCVSGSDPSPVHAHVPQYHTVLPTAAHQIPTVLRLLAHDQLSNPGSSKAIIFFPTTKTTVMFANILRDVARQCLPAGRNTRVFELHSKRAQESRTRTSDAFRADTSGASVLITSDVSARGVDYPGVTRVIQVGIPSGAEQYVHRVGRTGRAGRTNGRGDLVLLPWEVSFVTWQLTKVPLKPLTVSELKAQVTELAAKHDANPTAFFDDANVPRKSNIFSTQPLAPILADVDRTASDLLAKVDPTDIEETFMSLLGFYVGHAQELRIRKGEILEGCKDWAVDAMGLQAPLTSVRRCWTVLVLETAVAPNPRAGSTPAARSHPLVRRPHPPAPPLRTLAPPGKTEDMFEAVRAATARIVANVLPVASARTGLRIVEGPAAMTRTTAEAIAVLEEARAHAVDGIPGMRSKAPEGPSAPLHIRLHICNP